ncbi:hypothetical protein ARTSIC4J27_1561 [Pseudarthrobacter siccitolerans]|uniref:Uncharacterized protein n=1 Tax=Pseudarthrobacter siccitolerans TaxID=861266 RepID=A0A024H1H0_9MICC|nr:hypothetical protein ARTSIC4J27_1561 [Pseudarthrobacter siccitolerans]
MKCHGCCKSTAGARASRFDRVQTFWPRGPGGAVLGRRF